MSPPAPRRMVRARQAGFQRSCFLRLFRPMLDEGSAEPDVMTRRVARALFFSALMLVQLTAPLAAATPTTGPERVLDTDVDLTLLDALKDSFWDHAIVRLKVPFP